MAFLFGWTTSDTTFDQTSNISGPDGVKKIGEDQSVGFLVPQNCTVSQIYVGLAEAGKNFRVGLYADDDTLLAQSAVTVSVDGGQYVGIPDVALSANDRVFIALHAEAYIQGYHESTSYAYYSNQVEPFANGMPNPFVGGGSANTKRYELWADGAVAAVITDVDGDEAIYPGQSYQIQASDDIGAAQGQVFLRNLDGTEEVAHTVTGWDNTNHIITATAVQGSTHEYGALYEIKVVLDDLTEIIFDNSGAGITLEAEPTTGYVNLNNPITDDETSVCFGATPTPTSAFQFQWKDSFSLGNLSTDEQGFPSADKLGDFEGRFHDGTEWGPWETYQLIYDLSILETIVSSDTVSGDSVLEGTISESLNINDSASTNKEGVLSIDYTLSVNDLMDSLKIGENSLSESINANDEVSGQRSSAKVLGDDIIESLALYDAMTSYQTGILASATRIKMTLG